MVSRNKIILCDVCWKVGDKTPADGFANFQQGKKNLCWHHAEAYKLQLVSFYAKPRVHKPANPPRTHKPANLLGALTKGSRA